MAVKAIARDVNMSAQKARLVADMVRGMPAEQALNILKFSSKKAAKIIHKVLRSAIYNAENNYSMFVDAKLKIVIYVDQGTYYRRFMACAKGRSGKIRKPRCHITVELSGA